MLDISVEAPGPFVGPNLDFIKKEILRVGASAEDVRSAFAFVASEASYDPRAYQSLSPQMRRLVDLITVAGDDVSALLIDLPTKAPAIA